jgi:hypothetical protein
MILSFLLRILYPCVYVDDFDTMCKPFQNMACLSTVLFASYAIYTDSDIILSSTIQYVKYFTMIDLLICSPEILIHHCAVLGIIIPYLDTPDFYAISRTELIAILKTEISTIFLVLHNIIPKKYGILYILNNVLFTGSFAYTRIYSYSHHLIYNEALYDKIDHYLTPINATIAIGSIYTLYFLNIYWMAIIVNTIIKQFVDYLPTYKQCESIIKYMFFMSPVVSLAIYDPLTNPIYWVDIVGQSMLSVSSYIYHNAASKLPIDKNWLENDIVWLYINDVLLIHVRCFGCVVVNTNLYGHLMSLSSAMHLQMVLLYLSFAHHCIAMYAFVKYVMGLKRDGVVMRVNEHSWALLWPLHLCQGLPILVDSLIVAFSTDDFNARTNILLITALIFINGKIAPFYQANHFVFHGLLLIQTIFLCNANVIANRGFEL